MPLLRPLGTGAAAGILAGLVAGVGARIAMRWISLADGIGPGGGPASAVFTVEGTMAILGSVAIAGAPFGMGYLALRPGLPGGPLSRGLAYGLLLLALLGPLFFLSNPAEFGAAATRGDRVALFAALFLLYGAAVGVAAAFLERLAPQLPGDVGRRAAVFLGLAGLGGAAFVTFRVLVLARDLATIYGERAVVVAIPWLALAVAVVIRRR